MGKYSFSHLNETKKGLPIWAISGRAREVSDWRDDGSGLRTGSPRQVDQPSPPKEDSLIVVSASLSMTTAGPDTETGFRRRLRSTNHLKRALDLLVASILFVLLLPFLMFLAGLVWFSGPGPIIFRQERIGAHNKPFVLLKFRTMVHSSEFAQATTDDPRVTAIGRILRRLSFDEFVQLVNVIKGEMSLVGPRPHSPKTRVEGILFEEAVKSYQKRYAVKPGITGLAQIRGQRGETRTIEQLEDRVASDIEYIENWSIWLDISIFFRTISAVVTQVNAY